MPRRERPRRRSWLATAAAATAAAIGCYASGFGSRTSLPQAANFVALGPRGSPLATSSTHLRGHRSILRYAAAQEIPTIEDNPDLAIPRSASKGRLPELQVDSLPADKRQLRRRVDAFEQERQRLLAQVQQWKRDGSLDEHVLKALQDSFSRIVPDKVSPRRYPMPELDAERVSERQRLDRRVDAFQDERRRLLAQIQHWKQQGNLDEEVVQVLTELLGKPSSSSSGATAASGDKLLEEEVAAAEEQEDVNMEVVEDGVQEAVSAPSFSATEEALSARLDAAADQLQRQAEEFQRFRARVASEEQSRAATSRARLAGPLLELLESFERALQGASEDAQSRTRPLQAQLLEVLKRELEIEPMRPSVGERFDPAVHEAVGVAAGPQAADTILEELSRGYVSASDGSVVRPAKVLVSKGLGLPENDKTFEVKIELLSCSNLLEGNRADYPVTLHTPLLLLMGNK
eukprot:CAMPEP_0206448942 /NCGR_PEP_ID=MMETSP0324_2-20121206/17794_1 /ASSEMBLY_ACC=CAM_ASM_000836 /TAXON_ID=2866 /ORGANISM="Crypthecodinium cohnii, Strain Seligo" /LENGTH=460 /DNA_ID=CAMNT_0053918225 /DNA_START=125 /DNA_END=1508 /DNA_ORIENTATION=+